MYQYDMSRLGWAQDREDHADLVKYQTRFDLSHYSAYAIPKRVNYCKYMTIKDQDGIGACSGFSRSSLGEWLQGIISKWSWKGLLSPNYCYITNQERCNLVGKDNGATISGSAKAARLDGFCQDQAFPFEGRYDPNIPQEARTEGKLHLVNSHSLIDSYQNALQYIGTAGAIQIGIPVGTQFQNCTGPYTRKMIQQDCQNPEGGHALLVHGYDYPDALGFRGSSDRAWLIGQNSWTDQYGSKGFFFIEPEGFEYLLQLVGHGEVEAIGMSHLKGFDDRNDVIDHSEILC